MGINVQKIQLYIMALFASQ
ncbi:hypothetical protein VTO73DRAFT_6433 [Trametes versicolor]